MGINSREEYESVGRLRDTDQDRPIVIETALCRFVEYLMIKIRYWKSRNIFTQQTYFFYLYYFRKKEKEIVNIHYSPYL